MENNELAVVVVGLGGGWTCLNCSMSSRLNVSALWTVNVVAAEYLGSVVVDLLLSRVSFLLASLLLHSASSLMLVMVADR